MIRRLLPLCAALWLAPPPAAAGPPPDGQCPTISGPLDGAVSDAVARRLREGEQIGHDLLLALRSLLPHEIWQNRHVFFYPGMRMVIGDCHRVYPVPGFFSEATARYSAGVSLDPAGNLFGYEAGLPFEPESIDLQAPDAGVRWAWNLEHRFRGAGPVGKFRLVDMAGGRASSPVQVALGSGSSNSRHTYKGFFFFLQTQHRADLAASKHAVEDSRGKLWIAGGRFHEPFDARHLAWRQMRPEESHERYLASDETFVYVPTMRKVRRAATTWVDGVYVPRYRVGGDSGGGGLAIGGDQYSGPGGVINPTSALSAHQTENIDKGFTALALRPNAYVWRVLGEREVLAPMNGSRPGYPVEPNRNFGPQGLSVANDTWDVRWAVVIEGKARNSNRDFETLTLYVDWQTQQPLYAITKARRGRILNVGIPVHRFSDDVVNYPSWPGGELASVFDPVAEVFYRVADDSGWRRESYDVRSTPTDEKERRRFTSTSFLTRGR